MAHDRRLASLSGHVAAAGGAAASASPPAPGTALRFACSTTPDAAEHATDALGNAWRLRGGQIQRADCYLRSQPWTAVAPPPGAAPGAAWAGLATVAAGPVYLTDGETSHGPLSHSDPAQQ